MEEYELLGYAAVRSRLAPVSLAPATARRLVTKGWAEPYEMLTGLEAIRLTDEGMRHMPAWFDRLRSGGLSARDAAFDRDEPVRAAAAACSDCPQACQRSLALDASPLVRTVLAGRSDLDSRAADMLCANNDVRVLRVMAGRSDLSDGQKAQLAEIRDARVLESLGLHDAAAFLDSLPFAPAPRAPKRGLFG